MTYPADVLALAPAHYWRMGAASGAETDLGSSPASLTVSGATRDVTGPTALGGDDDGACSFDGSNDFASAALNLSSTGTVTVAAWVKIDAYDTSNALLWEHTATWNSNDGAINVNPNNSTGGAEANTWSIGCGGPSGKARVTIPQSAIPATQWHHLAVVFALTGSIKVYVDGAQITATVRDGGAPGGTFANSTFYLASRAGGAQFLAHDQDELVVALSEVSAGGIAKLAAVVPPTPATLYVNKDHGSASDAGNRAAAQNAATPLAGIARALALAQNGDTIQVTKASTNYGPIMAEDIPAVGLTIQGAAGGSSAPVFTRRTIGRADTWTFRDIILDGTPGDSDFLYENHSLTDERVVNRQGGGQILAWTGHHRRTDCATSAPWSPEYVANFMTGSGWHIGSQHGAVVAAEDLTFLHERFVDIGGEDAVQLLLGNNSHTGTVRIDGAYYENVRQGAVAGGGTTTGGVAHTDCIQSTGCGRLEVVNCEMGPNCESFLIASDDYVNDLLFDNNKVIGTGGVTGYSVQLSGVRSATVRHNTLANSRFGGLRWYVNNNAVASPVRAIVNNIIDTYDISDGWTPTTGTQHHNLIGDGPITANDFRGYAEFGSSPDTDYELANSGGFPSPGIDQAAVTSVTTDRLGRPRHGAPDCGCHESNPAVLVGASPRAPRIVAFTPADGATGVDRDTSVAVTFSPKPGQTLDAATVTSASVRVRDADGYQAPATGLAVGPLDGDGNQTVTLTIDGRLYARVQFETLISGGIADTEGSTLGTQASASWRTAGPASAAVGSRLWRYDGAAWVETRFE